jgi:hypothetical protein
LPRLFRLRTGQLGLDCRQPGLRRLHLASCPLVVEPREEVASPDDRADIDRPGENLPADPKTQIGFVSRLDLTGLGQSLTDIEGFDRNHPDRPDCRRQRGRLVASREQRHCQRCSDDNRKQQARRSTQARLTLRRSPALAVGGVSPSAWPFACLPGSSCSL